MYLLTTLFHCLSFSVYDYLLYENGFIEWVSPITLANTIQMTVKVRHLAVSYNIHKISILQKCDKVLPF